MVSHTASANDSLQSGRAFAASNGSETGKETLDNHFFGPQPFAVEQECLLRKQGEIPEWQELRFNFVF
jgi:hypothetical protein